MKNALVTGGAGFIGSHVVERLLQDGWRVRVLDNFSSGSDDNLEWAEGAEVEHGDIRDLETCQRACRGTNAVFHLAAIASVQVSIDKPVLSHDINLGGTLNMLLAARDQGVQRFVFSSSASVYGNSTVLPTTEDLPLSPQSPYASGKACGEFYCRHFWDLFGLETVVLRYFNVFGPRQNARSGYAAVIPRFVEAAITGAAPVVFGDGGQTRDFVYVGNVADANLRAATAPCGAGGVFNVGGGTQISLLDLLDALGGVTGRKLKPEFLPARAGEVYHSRADINRAREVLGYGPTLTLARGLAHTLAWAGREAEEFPAGRVAAAPDPKKPRVERRAGLDAQRAMSTVADLR